MRFMDKPQRPMEQVFMDKPRESLHESDGEQYNSNVRDSSHACKLQMAALKSRHYFLLLSFRRTLKPTE